MKFFVDILDSEFQKVAGQGIIISATTNAAFLEYLLRDAGLSKSTVVCVDSYCTDYTNTNIHLVTNNKAAKL